MSQVFVSKISKETFVPTVRVAECVCFNLFPPLNVYSHEYQQ